VGVESYGRIRSMGKENKGSWPPKRDVETTAGTKRSDTKIRQKNHAERERKNLIVDWGGISGDA